MEEGEGVVALGVGGRGVGEEGVESGRHGVEGAEGAVGEVEGFEAEGERGFFVLVDDVAGGGERERGAEIDEGLGEFAEGVGLVDEGDFVVGVEDAVAKHFEDATDADGSEGVGFGGAEGAHAGGSADGDAAAEERDDLFGRDGEALEEFAVDDADEADVRGEAGEVSAADGWKIVGVENALGVGAREGGAEEDGGVTHAASRRRVRAGRDGRDRVPSFRFQGR